MGPEGLALTAHIDISDCKGFEHVPYLQIQRDHNMLVQDAEHSDAIAKDGNEKAESHSVIFNFVQMFNYISYESCRKR